MSSAEDPRTIEVLATIGEIALGKRGHELRVTVADAGNGNGAAVDVREYVTDAAHAWRDGRKGRDLAKGRRLKAADSGPRFTGPTRRGWWLYPAEALALWEALGRAIELAAQPIQPPKGRRRCRPDGTSQINPHKEDRSPRFRATAVFTQAHAQPPRSTSAAYAPP